jgi:hypothetical protein
VALIDVLQGAVVGTMPACASGELVTGLAMGTDEAGTLTYLALWGTAGVHSGRVVALDVARGLVVATHQLIGLPEAPEAPEAPGALALAPAPDGTGHRLYGVTAALDPSGPPTSDLAAQSTAGLAWRLLGLNPATLAPETEHPLLRAAYWLTVSPDGREAYAFDAPGGWPSGSRLQRVNLAAGTVTSLGRMPGLGVAGLAVTADRLYIADTISDRLLVADRAGRPGATLPVGRRPLGVAVGPARRDH